MEKNFTETGGIPDKMIISASRRTDIPGCHGEWFMDCLAKGHCMVQNPYNCRQASKISLLPEDVDCFVFWTKNAGPFLPCVETLGEKGYRFYFHYTINDYPPPFEPCLPPLRERLESFRKLSRMLDPARVIWRFDPIILSNITGPEYHLRTFREIAAFLHGYTRRVILSIVDYYAKTRKRLSLLEAEGYEFPAAPEELPETDALLGELAKTAVNAGLAPYACAEKKDYSRLGILPARCIDGELIESLWHTGKSWKKDPGQRKACGCAVSRDIGANGTCRNNCAYCYAACGS